MDRREGEVTSSQKKTVYRKGWGKWKKDCEERSEKWESGKGRFSKTQEAGEYTIFALGTNTSYSPARRTAAPQKKKKKKLRRRRSICTRQIRELRTHMGGTG